VPRRSRRFRRGRLNRDPWAIEFVAIAHF
jgi:hypothetical protein